MSRVAAVVATALIVAAACAPTPSPSPAASSSTQPSSGVFPSSPVVGVVTSVDSAGLNDVSVFELRTDDGRGYEFEIGDLENAAEFPPGHLREHLATSTPVRVFFDVDGDRLVVKRLEDAS